MGHDQQRETQPRNSSGPLDALGKIAAVAALVAFLLYVLRFLVWESYLESYGASLSAFLPAQFVAAAISYLYYTAAIAIPVLLLSWQLEDCVTTWVKPPAAHRHRASRGPVVAAALIWLVIYLYVFLLSPPGQAYRPDWHWNPIAWYYLLLLPLLVAAPLMFIYFWKVKRCKRAASLANCTVATWMWLLKPCVLLIVSAIWATVSIIALATMKSEADYPVLEGDFLNRTMAALLVLVPFLYYSGRLLKWSPVQSSLVGMVVLIIVLFQVRTFGRFQFGHVERGMGGALPETATLTVKQCVPGLNTNVLPSARILLRTENEVVFLYSTNSASRSAYRVGTDLIGSIRFDAPSERAMRPSRPAQTGASPTHESRRGASNRQARPSGPGTTSPKRNSP